MTMVVPLQLFPGYSRNDANYDAYSNQFAVRLTGVGDGLCAWYNSDGSLGRSVASLAPEWDASLVESGNWGINPITGNIVHETLKGSSNVRQVLRRSDLSVLQSVNQGTRTAIECVFARHANGAVYWFSRGTGATPHIFDESTLVGGPTITGISTLTDYSLQTTAMSPDPATGQPRWLLCGRTSTGDLRVQTIVRTVAGGGTATTIFEGDEAAWQAQFGIATPVIGLSYHAHYIPGTNDVVFSSEAVIRFNLETLAKVWAIPDVGVPSTNGIGGRPQSFLAGRWLYVLKNANDSLLRVDVNDGTAVEVGTGLNYWNNFVLPNGNVVCSTGNTSMANTLLVPDTPPGEPTPITLSLADIEGFRSTRLARSNTTGVLNTMVETLQADLLLYADGDTENAMDMNNRKITNLTLDVLDVDAAITLGHAQELISA